MKVGGNFKKWQVSQMWVLTGIFVLLSWGTTSGLAQLPPTPKKPTSESQEQTPEIPETPPQEQTPSPTEPVMGPENWRFVRLAHTFEGQESTPQALLFSPDGQHLISGGGFSDPNLRVWSMKTGQRVSEIKAQRTSVQALAITPNGKVLVSGGEDGGINMWDWKNGQYLGIWLDHEGQIMALDITPNGEILASGSLDGIRIWTLNPRRPLYRLTSLGNPSYALAIKSDGVTLASGDLKGKVRFFNIKTGTFIAEFFPHKQAISGLIFTPDGKKLITSSNDGTIKIWDLETGQLIYTLTGHGGEVRAIALNSDGKTLASAGNDGIRIWDIESGELVNRIVKHYDWVQSIAFSPDGRYLASGGFDFKINIWERSPKPILQHPTRVEQIFEQTKP